MMCSAMVSAQLADTCLAGVEEAAIRGPVLLQTISEAAKPISCPIRGQTIKTGIVLPSECIQLTGKWVRSWQQCGAACTRMRACKAWTFKSGRCNMYKNGQKTCGFVSRGGMAPVAGC